LPAHLREHQAGRSEEGLARIELNPLRAFDSEHEGTKRVMAGAPRMSEHLSEADAEHFAEVCELLGVANVPYELDETLVRGLDYYTRTVFEFTSEALGAQGALGGGGGAGGVGGGRGLRGPRPGPGRPPGAGHGLGGRDRADPARERARAGRGRHLRREPGARGGPAGAVRGARGAGRRSILRRGR